MGVLWYSKFTINLKVLLLKIKILLVFSRSERKAAENKIVN